MTFLRSEPDSKHKGEHTQQRHIEAKDMDPLLGSQVSLYDLSHRLSNVETKIQIYGGFIVAILIGLVGFLLRYFIK